MWLPQCSCPSPCYSSGSSTRSGFYLRNSYFLFPSTCSNTFFTRKSDSVFCHSPIEKHLFHKQDRGEVSLWSFMTLPLWLLSHTHKPIPHTQKFLQCSMWWEHSLQFLQHPGFTISCRAQLTSTNSSTVLSDFLYLATNCIYPRDLR